MKVSLPFIAALLIAAAALVAGCVQMPQLDANPIDKSTRAQTAPASDCLGLNDATDAEASRRLDIVESMLKKLRGATGKTNEQICAMAETELNRVMATDRNKYRNPDRKTFRAPAKDYILQWDADDEGKLPSSSQVLAADTARRSLLARGHSTSGGSGVTSIPLAAGISNTQWTEIGPGNIGGRIRSILIDPRDQNRIFVGAASGGIWLSVNAGQSFRAVQDFMGNLAIGSMAMDPSNPNILYAGTGESFSGLAGIGMFKSLDGGATWAFVASTSTDTAINPLGNEWGAVNRIAVSPANPNLVLAATSRGSALNQGAIMRSTSGGNTWTRIQLARGSVITTDPPAVLDLKFDPNNPDNAVAGTQNGHVYYSRDAGETWIQSAALVAAAKGRSGTARAELAYAMSRPNLVFMSLDNAAGSTGARGEVWKSDDGGATWTMLSAPGHLSEQGDYDNTLWVDPTNENHIVTGGLDLYQSQDAGANFTRISTWQQAGPFLPQPHADHHQIVSVPNFSTGNPIVYFGNDGGLYRASNVFNVSANGTSSWQNLNNGLAITQFYGGAGKRSAGGKIIGGTQDNGTLVYDFGTSWDKFAGGDGGFVAVDPVDDSTLYGEYVYASIHRTVGLASRKYICGGITEALKNTSTSTYCGADNTELANFIAPFILDPNSRNRMLVAANSLWLSNNVRDSVPTWAAIKAPVPSATQSRHFINAIAVQEGNSNVIWASHNASNSSGNPTHIYKTTNGLDATPVWLLKTQAGMPTAAINRITIDPGNPNRVWVVYSGFSPNRLWETTDGGNTWHDLTGNLPAVTLHDIKRHPAQSNWLYVAAANGVYTSENGGQAWSTSNDGPASVRVRELFWYDPGTLVAATYGRGMFKASVTGGGPINYSDMWWAGQAENGWGMSIQQHGQIQFNTIFVYDSAGKPTWYVLPGGAWNSDFTTYSGLLYQGVSAPLNNYNLAQFMLGPPVGNISINFTGASTALMQYVINGISGQKSIQRQVFGSGTSPLTVGDMWWGGKVQDGWGISITQQQGILFGAWYTYGPDGKATWYAMTNGSWTGNTYTGTFFSTLGSPWIGTAYNPNQLQVLPAGTLSLTFSDGNNALMTYTFTAGPFAGTTQTKPIVRLAY